MFAKQNEGELGEDNVLPISGLRWQAEGEQAFLLDLSSNVILRSRFVAMAGRGDSLEDVATVSELCFTTRRGLCLDSRSMPVFELKQSISSYVYDLWKDPQDVSRTTREIGNRTSHGLKHFALSMKAIVASLERRKRYKTYQQAAQVTPLVPAFPSGQVQSALNHLQLDLCSKFGAIVSNKHTESSDD